MSGSLPVAALSRLAWRNLWRNYRRTLIMLLAIALGAWAMIFMTALMRGMVDQMVEDGIRALPGHVQVHHPLYRDDPSIENSMSEPGAAFAAAMNSPAVTGWTARLRVPAMISSERENRGLMLLGVDPDGEVAVGFEKDSIVEGRWLERIDDSGIVVGKKMLERLETRLGKRVVLMSQGPDNEIADRGFRIVGVFEGTLAAQEEAHVYAGRTTVQRMLNADGEVSEIAVAGRDYRDVGELEALVIEATAGKDVTVRTWKQLDSYLDAMLGVMDGFVLVWMVVIFLALSFGLVNTLMMAVFERIREIGLMQALGMKPSAILYQILLESLFLLALGLLLGNVLAVASVYPIRGGVDLSVVAEGMEMFGASAMLYPALKTDDMILANAVVIVLGILTSLIPAWRASRYRPVEAIAKT